MKRCYLYVETLGDYGFQERYWTGKMTESNNPAKTQHLSRALSFDTPRDAYDRARHIKGLEWFKAGRR